MLRILLLAFALAAPSLAQVKVTLADARAHIEIDGKPFTDFFYGPDTPKPYLHPLRSASGKIVTRRFPMEKAPGESVTDQHHRGVFFGLRSINGANFWDNEFSYRDPKSGKVITRHVEAVPEGVHGLFAWLSPSGDPLLEEDRTMTFHGDGALRTVDIEIALKAVIDATFADVKDGAFSVRLAEPLTEKNSGTITNSAGGRKMAETWGKPADWVDYSGTLDGEALGVALFDHPSSLHHPARWHVRDYGLLTVNPFGSKAFDKDAPDATFTLARGQSVRLRYQIVVHPALDTSGIARLYRAFATSK